MSDTRTELRDTILHTGLAVFRESGYTAATLDQIAARAHTNLDVLRKIFPDKESLFNAILAANSPVESISAALDEIDGSKEDSAEGMIREAMRRMVGVFAANEAFMDLAALDFQVSGGAYLSQMSTQLLPKLLVLFTRIKATDELRPVPDPILARTLVAMLIGFVISEKAMPKMARLATRLFPERAWLDGMVDLLLYGVLEDSAR